MNGSFLIYDRGLIRWDCVRNISIEQWCDSEWSVHAHLSSEDCYSLGVYPTLEEAQALLLKIIDGLRPKETPCASA